MSKILNVTKLAGGNIVITTGSSAPATHEETWYKYAGDTEWRTKMLGGTIQLTEDGEPTGQIENPYNIVAIEIGTGTQANPVTSIGYGAFVGCSGLTSVAISSSVTYISDYAFRVCSSLTSVTIPDLVTYIGVEAFSGCSSLETITVLGKTTSEAQTLLANASVPEGCTIIGELG